MCVNASECGDTLGSVPILYCVYVSMRVYVCVCMYACMYVEPVAPAQYYVYVCMHACVCMYVCMYIC
jgi:hypothetical protein